MHRAYVEVLEARAKSGLKADVIQAEKTSDRLQIKIEQFNERMCGVFPAMNELPIAAAGTRASKARLLLPSQMRPDDVARFGLQDLAIVEKRLRIGACFDLLTQLKLALGVRSSLTRHHRQKQGYKGTTRSQGSVKRAEANVKRHGRSYCRSWLALDRLGVPEDERFHLQELKQEDMTMLGRWLEGEQYRKGGSQLPWIWTTQPPARQEANDEENENESGRTQFEAEVDKWNREGERGLRLMRGGSPNCLPAIRLEWVHAKAALMRWEEELRLLKEEARRVSMSFRRAQEAWLAKARSEPAIPDREAELGFSANARKHATVFRKLADQAQIHADFYAYLPVE